MKKILTLTFFVLLTLFAADTAVDVYASIDTSRTEQQSAVQSVEIELLALKSNSNDFGYVVPASGHSNPNCRTTCTGFGRGESCTRVCPEPEPVCSDREGDSCLSVANSCGMRDTGTVQCNGLCSAGPPPESSCTPACAGNQGSTCYSSANSCGIRNAGTVQCNGSCNATTPSNSACGTPCASTQGNSCTSAANSCGMRNSGTIQCNGSCTASTPSNSSCAPSCVSNQGNTCTSGANSCGMRNSGTIQCNGSCSASTPSNSSCPQPVYGCTNSSARNYNPSADTNDGSCVFYPSMPTVTIDVDSEIVRSGEDFEVEWDPNGWLGTCQLLPASYFSGADANSSGSAFVTVTSKTQFVYRCTAAADVYAATPRSSEVEVEVEVIPAVQEI